MDIFDLSATLRLDADQYYTELGSAERAAKGLGGGFSSANSGVGKLTKGFTVLRGAAANLVSSGINKVAGAITNGLGGAISRVDTLNNYSIVMENLGHDSKSAQNAINRLKDGIDGLPTTLDGIASVQQQFAALGGSLDDATDLTLALNNATLAGGQGQEKANAAMQQWYQMIAAGKPDLMSMRIINEAMPAQLNAIAEATLGAGKNWQDLNKEWQANPEITEKVKKAILDLNENGVGSMASFEEQAIAATGGINTSLTNLKTKITNTLGEIIQAIGAKDIAAGFQRMKDGIGVVGTAITDLITAFKGEGVGGVFHMLTLQGTKIDEALTNMAAKIDEKVPVLAEKGAYLLTAFAQAIGQRIPKLLSVGVSLVSALVKGIANALPTILQKASALISSFADSLSNNRGVLLDKIKGIAQAIGENLPGIIRGLVSLAISLVKAGFQLTISALASAPAVVAGLAKGIWNAFKNATIAKFNEIKNNVKKKFIEIRNVLKGKLSLTNFKETLSEKIESLKRKLKKFKENFPYSLGKLFTFSLPKLPKLVVSGGKKIKKLLGIEGAPKLQWAAKGGIMNAPTLVGAGEAGSEALLPLDPFWRKMDDIQNAQAGQTVQITNYITVEGAGDAEKFVDELVRKMKIDMRTA